MSANKTTIIDPDNLKFSVDSQLLGELGEKLVTNNYIALAELIKNSYDADSKNVLIELINVRKGGRQPGSSKIIISDHGCGMTFKEVRDRWMRVATANKLETPQSQVYGRPKTGNKGIGRFACQRLAKYLVLVTTAKTGSRYETTTVVFRWRDFEVGTSLTGIPCSYRKRTTGKKMQTGTTLKLIALRDMWTERDFKMLQKNVGTMSVSGRVKRKSFRPDPGFDIQISAANYHDEAFSLEKKYLESGWGTLSGKVSSDGRVEYTLDCVDSNDLKYDLPTKYNALKGTRFTIHHLPFKKEFENRRDPSILTSGVQREILSARSGIRLYLNNFRVFPYGEEGDDWLEISKDVARRHSKVKDELLHDIAVRLDVNPAKALLAYPTNMNTIGEVVISGQGKEAFVVKMDREGLIENQAFRDLKKIIRLGMDWLTIHYESEKVKAKNYQADQAKKEFESTFGGEKASADDKYEEAVDYISALAQKQAEEQSETQVEERDNVTRIKVASDYISKEMDRKSTELMLLRSVAATGPLMFVFAHEVKGITSSLDTHAAYLRHLSKSIKDKSTKSEILNIADTFNETNARFNALNKLFNIFSSSQSKKKSAVPIKSAIEEVIGGFGFVLEQFNIQVQPIKVSGVLATPKMHEAEFYTIIVNLLSNAVKAAIAGRGRRIRISARKMTKGIVLKVCDDGVGIKEKHWSAVFEPLVTDPEGKIYKKLQGALRDDDLSSLGRGSGLGLSIVQGVIEKMNGEVGFVTPNEGWSACVQVVLPSAKGGKK